MNKERLVILISSLVILFLVLLLIPKLRTETTVAITSISADTPVSGDQLTIYFKVLGGAEDFSIIALPDTQHYSDKYPDLYYAQTKWIAENKDTLNIRFVTHLGDIVQNNDVFESEWIVADTAMRWLDGIVPYGVLPGNHDMQTDGSAHNYEKYFPASRYEEHNWWGDSYNGNKNNFQLFSSGGDEYIIIHLQYCPPDGAISWAKGVLNEYSEHKAIISTHAYLGSRGARLSHCKDASDGDNSGLDLWEKVVKPSENVFLVLSGHIPGVARIQNQIDERLVHQLLFDFQEMENGGNGYLRIFTFQPNQDNIRVSTYSPALDSYFTDPENQFDLVFDMTGGKLPSGTVTVTNGIDSCQGTVAQGGCELNLNNTGETALVAKYSGDWSFEDSQSDEVVFLVK